MSALEWSTSRHADFQACPRRYFCAHVERFDDPASPAARQAMALKRLVSAAALEGELLRFAAARVLRRAMQRLPTDLEYVVGRTVARAERILQASAALDISGRGCEVGLAADWYGTRFSASAFLGRLRAALWRLLLHPSFQDARRQPHTLFASAWRRGFTHEGVRIDGRVDLVRVWPTGKFTLVNWLTRGQSRRAAALQLDVAALWFARRFGHLPVMLENSVESVGQPASCRRETSAPHLDRAAAIVTKSAAAMNEFHQLAARLSAPIEAFPTISKSSRACVRCRFRVRCGRHSSGFRGLQS